MNTEVVESSAETKTEEVTELAPSIPIHPLAAAFPMMEGEELDALADDIRLNELRDPIVLDKDGQLLDGRNRLAACKLAGVAPTFVKVDVDDPIAYILGANVHRRQLLKSQCAMAYAKAHPEATDKGGRGKKSPTQLGSSMLELVRQARFVLNHSHELADKVMAGSSLKDAYARAVEQRDEQEQFERLRNEVGNGVDPIAHICLRLKANIETGAFLDKEDFIRQVRSDVKEIIEYAQLLPEQV